MHKVIKLITLFLILTFNGFGQLTINHPINRAVYQRTGGNPGTAILKINGSYSSGVVSSIQARLVTPNTSNPISGFNWQIIDINPTKGSFSGSLNNVPPGWYTLEVKATKSGTVLQSNQVDRVGVGDVFLISGQSNAGGINTSGFTGSNDERVVTHNTYKGCLATTADFPLMSQIATNSNLSGTGENGWAYGKLGQDLVGQTGYPVAFFNASAGGTAIENWNESSNGLATIHPFTGMQYCTGSPNAIGSPYNLLRNTITYYNSLYGIRALLWFQGEGDKFLGTSTSAYQNGLNTLISKVRSDFGGSIPWVVGRTSFFQGSNSSAVITGQNNVINNGYQVFAGPSTDDIDKLNPIYATGYRDDGTHFNDLGISLLADRWKNSLSPSFFNSSIPIAPENQPDVSISINGNNVTISAPSGYSSYKWINGDNFNNSTLGTSQSFTASTGTYRCYLKDNNGNITFTQPVNIDEVKNLSTNTISCSSGTPYYLSDLKPLSQYNGFGPLEFDKSNGNDGDGDGSTLTLNGVTYAKGLGVHATSEIIYQLPLGTFLNFMAHIGIDDEVGSGGSVQFQVFDQNNSLLYQSPTMNGNSTTIPINISIASVSKLKLKVIAIGSAANAHANWANARLTCTPPDLIPPSNPSNLNLSNKLTKCYTLGWSASTDNVGVAAYRIFKDGIFHSSVSAGQLSYTFSGLTQNTLYSFGVQAEDISGNLSAIVNTSDSTSKFIYNYPPLNNANGDICVNTPTDATYEPLGGTFEYISGPAGYNLNSTTGVFSSSIPNGFYQLKYTIQASNSCQDVKTLFLRANAKDAAPVISGSDTLLNQGLNSNFTTTGCSSGFNLIWFDDSNDPSPSFSLSDTTLVFAFCRKNGCFSDTSNVIKVKIIPDCPNSFNLSSTKDDLNGNPSSLYFNASQSIAASNKLSGTSNTQYQSGNTIILQPGFKADSGTVFSARIEGCP